MKITFYAKNLKLTPEIGDYVRSKIESLEHYIKNVLDCKIELDYASGQRTGLVYRCEVNMRVPKYYLIRAEETGHDIYEAIDLVISKLKKEIEKYKEKIERRTEKKRALSFWKIFGKQRKGKRYRF